MHKQADYCMMLFAAHIHKAGYDDIVIHATDTDVLVLCVAMLVVLLVRQSSGLYLAAQNAILSHTHTIAAKFEESGSSNTCVSPYHQWI